MNGLWHEQSFIMPISRRSQSLTKRGTPNMQPCRHIRRLLMVPMAVWRSHPPPTHTPPPHHCHHHTCIPLPHYLHPPVSHPFAHSVETVHASPNIIFFLKCQLISAVLERLHKLNMSINTFSSLLEKLQDMAESLIRKFALPEKHSSHSGMHSSDENSARCC